MVETLTKEQKLGDDISFGVQQTVACMATDWIEAPMSTRIQRIFETKDHKSTDLQNLAGELIGSIGSLVTFLGLRQCFPQIFDWTKSAVRTFGDKFYDKAGRQSLKGWAESRHTKEDSPEYKKKLSEWKDFQEDAFAKASVIHVANVGLNVVGQKTLLKNSHKWWVVTVSKMVSGLVAPAVMVGFRMVAPKTAQKLDSELNERYFTPLVHKTQRMLGVKETKSPHIGRNAVVATDDDDDREKKHASHHKDGGSYVDKISAEEPVLIGKS